MTPNGRAQTYQTETKTVSEWLSLIGDQFPCGPINNLEQVFAEPQVQAREMVIEMEHPSIGKLPLAGSPLKFSDTKVDYKLPPPRLGEHTKDILKNVLGYSVQKIENMSKRDVIL